MTGCSVAWTDGSTGFIDRCGRVSCSSAPPPQPFACLHLLVAAHREDIVRRLRLGDIWILITTDLMARGMDFKGVKLVVNYDFPQVGGGV